jgi:DNA-binding transcriptional ArsR family regulator
LSADAVPVSAPVEVFKALGDPVRWNIVTQLAQADEVACQALEAILPVSKPTISYHTRILSQAGLISVRKEGRNIFYSLRREVLHQVLGCLWELAPSPRPAVGPEEGYAATGRSARRPRETADEAVVLTW